SLLPSPPPPSSSVRKPYKVRRAAGHCEVIVETRRHEGDLSDLSVEELQKVIDVFADRYEKLGAKKYVKYVFEFRNKGRAIGVSLHHPHSQLYAFPFIPPKIRRELASAKAYMKKFGECLFCRILEEEKDRGERLICENEAFACFLPFFAKWPYETHVYSKRHAQSLLDFGSSERRSLAKILRDVTAAYNNLFSFSMPYVMAIHQKPTDGKDYSHYHFHIEFYPPYRTKDKLKFPAGIERGAGVFGYDGNPEEKARELKRALERAKSSLG
ncbi:TPA: galactose-1-phosphate uridylyltransferase, partial [Candidatus Bathyarchaeota archaeon]|nr:galactose-1-phosphate uridylyltransferase [Candidatus Bathyarchaeota archaeon]